MSVDRNLLSEFAKITNDTQANTQTQLYGTVVTQGDKKYVKMDGSDIITPIISTTDIKDGERVMVSINNHIATVTGNITNPSAGGDRVSYTEGKVDEFDYLFAGNITAENIAANSITADKILAGSITTDKLMAESIIADKIAADAIESKHIKADAIESKHIKADAIEAEHIKAGAITADKIDAGIITSDHIASGTITADDIATGTITAGSGIIAEGAIGSAQISSLDVAKLESGTIDTSKIYIAGADGHLQLKGNRLQVFDGLGNRAVERVSLGDVNGDGSKFGLRVRGADGETILLDENGVTSEGITDGSITNNKISDDANIDGAKLNINSVVSKINEDGTETIQGTKIEVDGTTLNTKLSTITNKQTEDGERITQAQSQISANTNAIKLKVDEQTYTTDKKDMTSKLEKNTSEISAMKGQIALKVEQTDIENAKSELEGTIDSKINTAKADIKITTDAISQNVSNLSQTVSNKADGSTVSSLNSKVSSLETSVNGISGKVTSLEKTTTTLGTQVNTANTNASSALNKANSATTTANNAQNTANTNKSNITDLQGEVSTVKNNVASLEVTTSGISQKVSSVESTTATLSGKVNTANNNATNALNKANSANTLADSKAKVFTSTPTVPYKVGDLWVQGTNGDVMKCKTARASGSYTVSDWEKASKYTDDTKANAVDGKVTTLQGTVNTTNSKVATLETNLNGITQRVSSTESTTATLTTKVNTAQSTADAAKTAASNAQNSANNANNALSINQQTKMNGIELFNNEYKSNTSARPFTNGDYSVVVATEISGANAYESNIIKVTNGQILYTDFIACNINNPYYASIEVYNKDTNNGTNYIQVCYYDKNKTALASNEAALNAISGVTIPSANAWHKLEGWVNVPASNDVRRKAKYVRIRIINRYSGLSGITYWRNISWKQLGSGLLVDTQETKTEIASTKSKVATIETNLNSITQRVSSTESTVSKHTTQLGTVDNRINTAKNSAISTAANDATTKANNAQTNAKSYTDGQITTVNKTITDKVAEIKTTTDAITSRVSKTEQVASSSLQGKMLYTDPTFKTGSNSINSYNNAGGGTVTVSRVVKSSDCPTTSGYMLQIKTTGTASPGHGGFYFGTGTRANAILITKIIAKIPSGCTLNWASNAYGTGGKQEWLTSTAGTGNWQEYICKVTCGTSGTFSSTNFFYLSGGITPVTWYVAMATVFDITDTSNIESRLSTAESKITETAITNTVKKNFYTKTETDSQITSKGYQTASQVQQTVNGLELKFNESGGYNLLYNSSFKNGFSSWGNNGGTVSIISETSSPTGNSVKVVAGGSGRGIYQFYIPKKTGYYTVSFYGKADANLSFYFGQEGSTTKTVTLTTSWQKFTYTFNRTTLNNNAYVFYPQSAGTFYIHSVLVEEGQLSSNWSPHPSEVYDGITKIDKDGITVQNSNSSTYTQIDSSSFRVENNTGGTVAEFSQNSKIPNLNAGIITANEVYANNIARKSTYVKNYYVAGGYGNDNEGTGGSWSNPCKTVQYVLDNYIEDILDYDVNIYVGESVPGWTCKSKSGKGVISFKIENDCIVRDPLYLDNCTNRVVVNGYAEKKGTFMTGIVVTGCHNFDIGWVSFRGKNWAHSKGSCNVIIRDGSKGLVRFNDFNGCTFAIIVENNSELWVFGNRGSDITHYIGISSYTTIYGMRSGTDTCPDFTGYYYADAGHSNLYHIHDGANYTKTPSIGWAPSYTPSQKTQTWSFNKIWSDETLKGWGDRQELIQGYASTWNTGRWTGYMQMTDDFAAIRNAISGGTNLSGRIYVQRTSSSGNSTGSKLCLYGSDGTLITNSTSINRSQGVWVSLSSSIIQKIQSGAIRYFYLKADANNTSTYFKCERNCKIEITYTK